MNILEATPGDTSALVVSMRSVLAAPAYANLFAFEDLVCEWYDASPQLFSARLGDRNFNARRRAFQLGRHLSIPVDKAAALSTLGFSTPIEGQAELAFVALGTPFDMFSLASLRRVRDQCRLVVVYLLEAWPPQFDERAISKEPWELADYVFVGTEAGTDALRQITDTPVAFLPPATDVLKAQPQFDRDRPLLASNPGRRAPAQHERLLELAKHVKRPYLYDTLAAPALREHRVHREAFTSQLDHSDLLVCNPAKFDLPRSTGGVSEVPMRFFEGLASGCLLVGHETPREHRERLGIGGTEHFQLSLEPTESELLRLRSVVADTAELRRRQLHNRHRALAGQDWAHRWQQICDTVGVKLPSKTIERLTAIRAEEMFLGGQLGPK